MAKEPMSNTMKVGIAIVLAVIAVSSTTAAVMSFMGKKDVSSVTAHTMTASILTQHSGQLQRHDVKLDEHEKRLDSTERTNAELRTTQNTIVQGVGNLQMQFIELIKETSETNAYIKSIEKEVQ